MGERILLIADLAGMTKKEADTAAKDLAKLAQDAIAERKKKVTRGRRTE